MPIDLHTELGDPGTILTRYEDEVMRDHKSRTLRKEAREARRHTNGPSLWLERLLCQTYIWRKAIAQRLPAPEHMQSLVHADEMSDFSGRDCV